MEISEVKTKMMKLWKDTFHDSDEYISLIFDNYFDPEFIEYHEDKNQIVSALIGIPYQFGNGEKTLSALYLCGLATKEEYRNKGIMTQLIKNINNKAKSKGFLYSFLIPASDKLRLYYNNNGYVNGMYRIEERYTDVHDFNKDCLNMINREEDRIRNYRHQYYDKLNVEYLKDNLRENIEKISQYITSKEHENHSYLSLYHSIKDITNIIKENLLYGGKIFVSSSPEKDINGVAFVTYNERKRIIIPKIYYDDKCVFYKILQKIKDTNPDSPISLWRYPEETDRQVLWTKVYGASNPDGDFMGGAYGLAERVYDVSSHATPYGMIKILNISELLKFLTKDQRNLKFSILIKDYNKEGENNFFKISAGKCESSFMREEDALSKITNQNLTVLTERELSEIIYRKKDSNGLIMEAFGIPRLTTNMALLLD